MGGGGGEGGERVVGAGATRGAAPATLWRATELAGLGPDAAGPAERGRLIDLVPDLRFRHPIIRAAAYDGASEPARRRAHGVLAAAAEVRPCAPSPWPTSYRRLRPFTHVPRQSTCGCKPSLRQAGPSPKGRPCCSLPACHAWARRPGWPAKYCSKPVPAASWLSPNSSSPRAGSWDGHWGGVPGRCAASPESATSRSAATVRPCAASSRLGGPPQLPADPAT